MIQIKVNNATTVEDGKMVLAAGIQFEDHCGSQFVILTKSEVRELINKLQGIFPAF